MRTLDVHLRGERIGTLFPADEGDCRLAYSPEAVAKAGPGATLLSTVLPARAEPYGGEAASAYLEGLLPEGPRRERIARELGIGPGDACGLLAEIGRDCAGAVSFRPQGAEVAAEPAPHAWLTEDELEELIACQPPRRLFDPGSEQRMRASLAGVHHKLALVREEGSGRWGWPGPGRPSTHIVKPETGEFPGLAANEHFCMEVARRAGLAAAHTEHETIAGRPCLVSRRFDRAGTGAGTTRIHQEDLCQALGFPPPGLAATPFAPAGEQDGGPGFAEACGLLAALGRRDQVPALLAAAVFNYALGNGDAHGKNFAVLHAERGPSLAPLYDLSSTVVYDLPTHVGMVLAGDCTETAYLLDMDYVCQECDYGLDPFRELVSAVATRIAACLEEVVERSRSEGWHAPVVDEIAELAEGRALGLGYEVEY
jgi:serine/threonine-protein kinase HipA